MEVADEVCDVDTVLTSEVVGEVDPDVDGVVDPDVVIEVEGVVDWLVDCVVVAVVTSGVSTREQLTLAIVVGLPESEPNSVNRLQKTSLVPCSRNKK